MKNRSLFFAVPGLAIFFVSLFAVLWRARFLDFSGTDASAKIVVSVLILVGVAITSLVTIWGLLLKQYLDQRNADLKEQSERRLVQETVIQAVRLLSTDSGKEVPRTQRAGVLFTLVQLGQIDLALKLVGQMLPFNQIDAESAMWVVDRGLNAPEEVVQRSAAGILGAFSKQFHMSDGECAFPESLRDEWKLSRSLRVRNNLARGLLRLLKHRPHHQWSEESRIKIEITLIRIWQSEKDFLLKNGIGLCLVQILRFAGKTFRIATGTEVIKVWSLREEIAQRSNELSEHSYRDLQVLADEFRRWANERDGERGGAGSGGRLVGVP